MPPARVLAVTRTGVREEDIFRLWLEHYRPHVDGFHIVLVREEGDDIAGLESLCLEAGAAWSVHDCRHYENAGSLNALRSAVAGTPCDWLIHADSDEFIAGIAGLRGFLAEIEAEGADHLVGVMIDRCAPGGELRSLDGISAHELAGAFPVKAELTRRVGRGLHLKAVVSRWPTLGVHPGPPLVRPATRRLALDHYKWRSGLRDRLVKRYIDYTLARIPWAGESQRLLDELQTHGRFRVENWPVPQEWPDY